MAFLVISVLDVPILKLLNVLLPVTSSPNISLNFSICLKQYFFEQKAPENFQKKKKKKTPSDILTKLLPVHHSSASEDNVMY